MKNIGTILLCCWLFVSCGANKVTSFDAEVLEALDAKAYSIQNDWLLPVRAGQINLIGNPNHLIVQQDSVDVYLPYFGVRQLAGSFNGEAGIKFSGPIQKYQQQEGKKGAKEIKFSSNNGQELLQFKILVYPYGETLTQIISTHRDNVSYRGTIEQLPDSL